MDVRHNGRMTRFLLHIAAGLVWISSTKAVRADTPSSWTPHAVFVQLVARRALIRSQWA